MKKHILILAALALTTGCFNPPEHKAPDVEVEVDEPCEDGEPKTEEPKVDEPEVPKLTQAFDCIIHSKTLADEEKAACLELPLDQIKLGWREYFEAVWMHNSITLSASKELAGDLVIFQFDAEATPEQLSSLNISTQRQTSQFYVMAGLADIRFFQVFEGDELAFQRPLLSNHEKPDADKVSYFKAVVSGQTTEGEME